MKYLINADLHLDDNRIEDSEDVLHQIEAFAERTKPDKYIIAGDITNKRVPSKRVIRLIINHFYAMSRIVRNIIVKIGNHDWIDDNNYSLDFLKETRNIYKLAVFKYPVVIDKYIYVDHKHVSEAAMGASDYMFDSTSYKTIIEKYPYVKIFIFGHIHKPQILSYKPLVLIPGSIDRIDFGERLDKKYIYLLNNFKLYKHSLKNRSMYQIDFNLNDKTYLVNDGNVKSFKSSDVNDAILKVVLRGKKEQLYKLDTRKIIDKFKNAYSLKIETDILIEKTDSQKKKLLMIKQDIGSLFNEYLKSKKLDEDREDFC